MTLFLLEALLLHHFESRARLTLEDQLNDVVLISWAVKGGSFLNVERMEGQYELTCART